MFENHFLLMDSWVLIDLVNRLVSAVVAADGVDSYNSSAVVVVMNSGSAGYWIACMVFDWYLRCCSGKFLVNLAALSIDSSYVID